MQRAAEVMLEEYGVEVSAEDAASPIVFGVRKGALPSNQQHAMEMQEEWQYKVYVHTKEGDRFIVELAYESMELDAIYENSLNAKASTGSFTELKDGEYYGLTEEMSQIARNRAPEIKKLLLSKDMEQLQNAMREDIWQEVSEDIASGGAAGIGIFVKVENLDVDKVGLQ